MRASGGAIYFCFAPLIIGLYAQRTMPNKYAILLPMIESEN